MRFEYEKGDVIRKTVLSGSYQLLYCNRVEENSRTSHRIVLL